MIFGFNLVQLDAEYLVSHETLQPQINAALAEWLLKYLNNTS